MTRTTRCIARAAEKYEAVATLIEEARKPGQPVLVGTTSIEKSETISDDPEEEAQSRMRC